MGIFSLREKEDLAVGDPAYGYWMEIMEIEQRKVGYWLLESYQWVSLVMDSGRA